MSDSSGGKRAAIAIGALGLLGLLWYANNGDHPKSPGGGSAANGATSVQSSGPGAGSPAMPTTTIKSAGGPIPPMMLGGADKAREALAQYLLFSEFPPFSRPADGSQEHLWKWNQLDPVGQAFATDKKGGAKISAELVLDKMFAAEGESITATVTVWRGAYEDATREPADAKVVGYVEAWRSADPSSAAPAGSASVVAPQKPGEAPAAGAEGYAPVETVTFTSVAGGPGHRYVAKFTPSMIAALKTQKDVRFLASVDADGHPFPFSQPFRYAATTPIVLLEQHSDQIVKGSLEVTITLDVKKLGPVMIQATLYDATGTTPIAVYDDYLRGSVLGKQEARIAFFGKAIHDKGIDGPYSIRAIHGFVKADDTDPPEIFWESKLNLSTGSYKATDFSSSEWDSPEKQAKINQYKQLISSFENK
jgi:hypothetical protein